MSRKARQEASLNYTSVTFVFLALAMLSVAGIMPYWTTFIADYTMGWPARQWGLLKLSGKYTNIVLTGADITWFQVRDTVCGASSAYTTGGTGMSMSGMAGAAGNAVMGVTCTNACKVHLAQRCLSYYQIGYLNLGIFGGLIVGALVSLTGAAMPLLGKERKRDRTTWLALDILGVLIVVGCLVGYYFYFQYTLGVLRQTSWFQMDSMGWCFMLAGVGAVLLIVPVIIQSYKIASAQDKKPDGPLLTSGANPQFLMPSAI